MKVDLLCVNYNTKDKLIRFLDTLQSDHYRDLWTLSIADNGSNDGSIEWLRANADKYPIDHLFLNPNVGYAKAINAMASVTNKDILCAVNADTWFTTQHVSDMIDCFTAHDNIAISGPKQMDENKRVRHGGIFWSGQKSYRPKHRGWNVYDPNDEQYKDLVRCWTVSGSIYYVRRSVWDEMTDFAISKGVIERNESAGAFLPTPHYY